LGRKSRAHRKLKVVETPPFKKGVLAKKSVKRGEETYNGKETEKEDKQKVRGGASTFALFREKPNRVTKKEKKRKKKRTQRNGKGGGATQTGTLGGGKAE